MAERASIAIAREVHRLCCREDRGVITGFPTGPALDERCDDLLVMASAETPRIQEGHEVVRHVLCELTEALCAPRGRVSSVGSSGPDW